MHSTFPLSTGLPVLATEQEDEQHKPHSGEVEEAKLWYWIEGNDVDK